MADSRTVTLRIPGHPPGGNEIHLMNRFDVRRSRLAWKLATVGLIGSGIPGPFARASIAVTWRYRVRRRRDLDNLVAGLKPIIDGIVSGGILEDDHSGVLVRLGPLLVETGCEEDETVIVIREEP